LIHAEQLESRHDLVIRKAAASPQGSVMDDKTATQVQLDGQSTSNKPRRNRETLFASFMFSRVPATVSAILDGTLTEFMRSEHDCCERPSVHARRFPAVESVPKKTPLIRCLSVRFSSALTKALHALPLSFGLLGRLVSYLSTKPNMDIRVELATQADVEAMAALHTLVIRVNSPGFEKLWPPSTVTPEAIHEFYTKSFTAALADPSSILVKATSAEGVLVGHGKAVFIPSECERKPSPRRDFCLVGCDIDLCTQIGDLSVRFSWLAFRLTYQFAVPHEGQGSQRTALLQSVAWLCANDL
jgi:hypothetical protein